MRKFSIFGRQVMIGKRLFGLGRDDETYGLAQVYGVNESKAIDYLDTYQGVVYACINLIAESVGDYQPVIYRKTKGKKEDIGDHPFLQLLRRPGGTDDKALPVSMFNLFFMTAAFIELQGDVYWYMSKGLKTGEPKEIVVLRADKVGRYIDKDSGDIEAFYVRTATGQKIRIEVDEMIPFIGFNPKNPYTGIGTVQAAIDYIKTDEHSTTFTKNFFKNNAGISGVLSVGGDVVKTAFKKFVRAWRDKYQGVENAGKVMIVRGSDAAKFEKIGLGLNELDMSSLRKMSLEDIAMMFRVPLPLLGKLSEGTGLGRGNIETLEYIFAKYNIEKKLKRYDQILQFALERYYKVGGDLEIGHVNTVPEDKEYNLNVRDKGVDRWITRDEIREQDGLPPVDGGDKLFVEFNKLPIDESSADTSAADNTSESSLGTGLFVKLKHKASHTAKKKDSSPAIASVQKENFRLSLMRNQMLYERAYKKKFNKVMVEQRREALNNLEAHASSIKSGPKLFDDALADAELEKVLVPVLVNLGEDQGALALLFAGDKEREFRMTAAYQSLLRSSTKRMASRFNDETIERLNVTLAEGIQAGETLSKLKDRVDSVYSYTESYRSLRVARTETLKASNNATEDAYQQTGYVIGKEWYVNPDACPICEAFQGKTINLGEAFVKQGESYSYTDANGDEQTVSNTYDDVDNPPLHPNCRCTIIPTR